MNIAQRLKSEGQQLALAIDPVWAEQALAFLRQFTAMRGTKPFLIEDMRFLAAWHPARVWRAAA